MPINACGVFKDTAVIPENTASEVFIEAEVKLSSLNVSGQVGYVTDLFRIDVLVGNENHDNTRLRYIQKDEAFKVSMSEKRAAPFITR